MSLSSAKAKLDAQGGDPVTGYISKTDHKESYDELVDDTALTGATTAEAVTVSGALVAGTVNGRDPDTLVVGPGSATDNALARFDGTTGKLVQNSGITVDDSNNITSNLTVSKASPTITASATSGDPAVAVSGAAGSYREVQMNTAGSRRWAFGVTSTAESGSNAGSNFYIARKSDAGAQLSFSISIDRASGLVTFADVGATAGLELGTSGPRVMSGTGSPEGVVTAPVGSRWIRTDGATLGDFEYQKRSGTGSTGWVVADGDTGSRNISASLENGWTGNVYLRRIGNTVELKGEGLNASLATSDTFYTLPTGFRANGSYPGTNRIGLAAAGSAMPSTRVTTGYSTGVTQIVSRGTTTDWDTGTMSWLTANAWPTVLPGALDA